MYVAYICHLLTLLNDVVGAPVALSSPHFLYGDPQLIHNVTGLHPNKEEHATWIDIDPVIKLPFL